MDTDNLPMPPAEPAKAPGPDRKPRRWANLIASVGLLLCIAAWFAMVYNENLSSALGIASLCLSILACVFTRRGIWRDIAITAIIGAAVLLLVFGLFTFGLDMLVRSI